MAIKILKILLIFALGAMGGLWAQIYLSPYLASLDYFQSFEFAKALKDQQVIINPVTEKTIVVQENVALQNAVEKVKNVIIGVETQTEDGRVLRGSGLIVTADGLLVTLADLVPRGSNFAFYVTGQWPAYQILKRDLKNNLVLIKIKDGGLPTVGFADIQEKKLGERVFWVSLDLSASTPKTRVNQGVITFLDNDLIQTNLLGESHIAGSPLFDIEGNVVGLSVVDEKGWVSAVSADVIRQFIGF